ncbi:MAG TPA: UTRA domain-containing protein, partial [Salinarimonas sp.]|nr:UTRA domain-containing protein [Salinarimonas sp.]
RSDLIVADEALAAELEVPPGRRWLRLQGFRRPDDTTKPPLSWTVVYVAAEYAGVERLMARQRASIWSLIEDMYGERLVDVEQRLRVVSVPPPLAEGLQVARDSTVVEIRRRYFTSSGKIAEIAINLYPSETFRFSMKLRRA